MKTHNQKTRLPRRLIGFVAAFALALSLLPVGVLTAFGENEAILQALNLAGEPEAVLAEEAPTSELDSEGDDAASTDEAADADVNEAEQPAEDAITGAAEDEDAVTGDEQRSDEKQESTISKELKAFTTSYEEATAAAAAKDKDALAKALETATGLHAMLSEDELKQADVTKMWAEIEGLRTTLAELSAEVTDPAATINGTGYETLQEAISAANAGDTITVAKDLTLTTGVTIAKAITLDLGGKKLTASGCTAVTVTGASATVTGGTIEVSGASDIYAVTVGASGSLTTDSLTVIGRGASGVLVSGGNYVKRTTNIQATDGYGIRVVSGGSVNHEGGMVVANYGVFIAGGDSTFNMIGGEISAEGYGITGNGSSGMGGTTINVSGGSITSSGWIAIYHPQDGALNVSGGSLTGNYGGIGIKSGSLSVTGGSISGTNSAEYVDFGSIGNGIMVWGSAIHVDSRAGYAGNLSISISGGTLSSNNGYAVHEVSDGSTQLSSLTVTGGTFRTALGSIKLVPGANASVSGGSFSHEVPAEYCATGFVCDGENGSFEIVRADSIVEAQVGDTTYKTLAEAIAAAKDGDTVVLLRSVSVDGEGIVVSGKAITLDLNGKTITGSGVTGAAVVSAAGGSTVTVLGNGGTIAGSDSPALATTGGSLVISGGSYSGNTTGCINAQQGAITVYGGTFGCELVEGSGAWNVLAGNAAGFKIYGGTFLNAEPAESQLASGCKVISDGAGKFDVTRDYSGNITLLDGTPVEGNTIVFADETTLQMIEVTDPNFGDVSYEWRAGFKVTLPEGARNSRYSQISDWFNDDGNGSQWGSAGSVADDGIYYVSSSQAMMDQYKGGDNQLMYRYAFDWDGDGVNDQYVTVLVKDTVKYADHQCEWDEGIILEGDEPGCTQPGKKTFECRKCHKTRTEEIPALGHDWDEWVYYDATCTTSGYREHYCQREDCDGEGWDFEDTTPALGHQWGDWELATEPTCTETGVECRWCERDDCDGTWEDGDGWDEREVPALGHAWGEWTVTKAATCTEDGEESHACATCGKVETETIPATGHHEVSVGDKAATCTETGLSGRTECSICHQVVNEGTVVPMLEHRVGVGAVIRAATCTTEGLMAFSCQDCGVQVGTETIPALGHAVAIDPAVVATCTTAGLTEGPHCTTCNEVLTAQQTIPALGHDWDEGEVTKVATCSATGVRTHHCTRCNVAGEQEIAIDPNAHSWGAWTVVRNAAVGVEGSEQRVCAHDGAHVETRAIAALEATTQGGANAGGTTGGNAAAGVTGGNAAAGGVEPAVTGGAGTATGTQGAGEVIEGDETPLAAPDETTIADDANPLAAGTVRAQEGGIDWMVVGIAVGAFVLVDGLVIAYVLRKRRRNRMM